MGRHDSDDRPKKSWRELDRQKDSSAHRNEPKRDFSAERLQKSQAYRSYKTQLNKLFDGTGELPEGLKSKLEEAGVGAEQKERKAAIDAISAAKTPRKIAQAYKDYDAAYGEKFGPPKDEVVLSHLLSLDDEPEILNAVLGTFAEMQEEGLLKRGNALKGHLKSLMSTVDDDDVYDACEELLEKL